MFPERFSAFESLRDRRVKWEQRPNHIDRDLTARCVMGLRVEQQTMPKVMWVLRLIPTSSRGVCDYEITWMIDSRLAVGNTDTFRNHVMTIVSDLPATYRAFGRGSCVDER